MLEGPRAVDWDVATRALDKASWFIEIGEFLTTEFGELAVRRRVHRAGPWTAPSSLQHRGVPWLRQWARFWAYEERRGGELAAPRAGDLGCGHPARTAVVVAKGPLLDRWRAPQPLQHRGPLALASATGMGSSGKRLTDIEVWMCQGRDAAQEAEGLSSQDRLVEGGKATGAQTAAALAGYLMKEHARAGGAGDDFDTMSMAKLLEWLRRWPETGLYPRDLHDPEGRRAGGSRGDRPDQVRGGAQQPEPNLRVVWRWGEALWLPESSDDESEDDEDDRRAAGRRGPVRRRAAEEAKGAAHVELHEGPLRPFDGNTVARVEDWIEENLSGYHADSSTTKQYEGVYHKWRTWAIRQGWATEFLDNSETTEANEDKLLGFLGYLGWLGASVATLKQAVFAIKDGHKRGGQGDKMFRLWMLLGALEKRAPKRARRLGVTPEMMKWIARNLWPGPDATAEEVFDAAMMVAAMATAWFFMLRAESNGVDYAMVLHGVDLKIELDANGVLCSVTLQFRKTKTDQEAFGTCLTMYASGVEDLCVVRALHAFRRVAPQRFGAGSEALKPLFRWASGQMLKRTQVQSLRRWAAVATGLPPDRLMSHSLRIGGASALFQATGRSSW